MAIRVPEVRQALQKGPSSRDELARDLHCGRADISKQIYSLIRAGEAIEEGDLVMLASQPRKMAESMDSTTRPQKIDSSPVSVPGMGIPEPDPSPATLTPSGAGCLGPIEGADPDQQLRAALELLMAELPGLLEDRERLRKLREVLG